MFYAPLIEKLSSQAPMAFDLNIPDLGAELEKDHLRGYLRTHVDSPSESPENKEVTTHADTDVRGCAQEACVLQCHGEFQSGHSTSEDETRDQEATRRIPPAWKDELSSSENEIHIDFHRSDSLGADSATKSPTCQIRYLDMREEEGSPSAERNGEPNEEEATAAEALCAIAPRMCDKEDVDHRRPSKEKTESLESTISVTGVVVDGLITRQEEDVAVTAESPECEIGERRVIFDSRIVRQGEHPPVLPSAKRLRVEVLAGVNNMAGQKPIALVDEVKTRSLPQPRSNHPIERAGGTEPLIEDGKSGDTREDKDGERVLSKRMSRRGPRSRSSHYRGVTFYRRTGRWESHIW